MKTFSEFVHDKIVTIKDGECGYSVQKNIAIICVTMYNEYQLELRKQKKEQFVDWIDNQGEMK